VRGRGRSTASRQADYRTNEGAGTDMEKEINHPVFAKLVRTARDELLTFREFPHLRLFGMAPAVYRGKPVIEHLDKSERKLVESWRTPSLKLAAICRKSMVYSSLRELGVFEMSVDVPNDGLPTPPQEAAYRHFSDDEQKVCANVVDALMRYYKSLRQEMPGAFKHLNAERRPDNPSVAELGRICRFDRLIVCRGVANGVSPLRFSWDPVWEQEHGLGTIVFQGQVIMIGSDTLGFLWNPAEFVEQGEECGWGKKQMTEKEKDALTTFLASYESEDEDEEGSKEGMTPMDLAVEAGQSSTVDLLLDRGASLEATLARAVNCSRWGILRSVLKRAKGKTLKIEPKLFAKALEECDDVAVIEGLLDVGASVQEEKDRHTPLYHACTNSNPEIVKLLLERGAKLSTSKTYSPLSAAINSRKLETVKLLLDAGLNLYAVPPGKSKGQVNLETRLQAEMNKPNPNKKEIKALQYLIEDEIERNSPKAPVFFLEFDEVPIAFKQAVIKYAARLGQKPPPA
jgi:Ankyrin repeats (3 copies)